MEEEVADNLSQFLIYFILMELFSFVLNFDEHLKSIILLFGPFTYVILFLIVFAETGLVIAPFLPGDSLLFAAGALAGGGFLNVWIVYFSLLIAAIVGDTVNYWIGHHLGKRVFSRENSKIFNKAYLERTEEFYKKYGGKTIILARFIPIIRTFAPFVAGVGKMHYSTFIFYNILGAFIWVTSLTFVGFFLGRLPIVKNNFELAVFAIVFVSILPVIIEYARHKISNKKKQDSVSYSEIKKTFEKENLRD